MKTRLTLLLMIICAASWAQLPAADEVKTSKGPLKIQPLNHATLALTWNGKTIYADPYEGAKTFEGVAAPDLVLITDIHGDHFDPATLEALDLSKAILVVPQAVADKMSEKLKSMVVIVNNGQTINKLGISITAIPMYNLPEAADAKHTKGRGNGYVLKMGDKTIYISGDTAGIPEMRSLNNIDVAFVCMNLPYTMDVTEAASAVLDFKPKIVYPYHYRGANGFSDTEAFKKTVNTTNASIDVRLRNWYPKK
ncbi:MBL fold metallo-hydrolase [Dyadobacter psychrotolerans]|uniref:MBL fold metallo-hydrolase n=1 Tax=Dyadobacter psychrotolerans TaxID=2541721 RepID=A0A4R5DWQ2_9BACT|nr:MBL fold metallo-hydrolase [Dyadobacter psychrotolerans]TDE15725.1 MBL fold metallo-hydrolase [Dyadobacter psychrotolerans]